MNQELTSVATGDEIHYKPWKYIGYKDLASYMASDQDFFAVRRFDRLHTRAILTLQARLEESEEKLDELDQKYASSQVKAVGTEPPEIIEVPSGGLIPEEQRRLDEKHVRDDIPERRAVIEEYTLLLKRYGSVIHIPTIGFLLNRLIDRLLLDYSQLRAQNKAPSWNVNNVRNWFKNNPGAIMPNESTFHGQESELLSLSRGSNTFARRCFQNSVLYPVGKTTKLFTTTPRFVTPRDAKNVHVFSEKSTETMVTASLFFAAVLMLITPLWILQAIRSMQLKLAVITVFIVVFLAFFTYAKTGRAFERLAATAG
ncbi:uncharacterized protein PG986_012947 [Apiospora aurea]|uniref:DUF6594 domain-containing protein n=1 Tax=Apiospora aurea TaxID=335848 RepID=A0ABR1Q1G4_9PEZI